MYIMLAVHINTVDNNKQTTFLFFQSGILAACNSAALLSCEVGFFSTDGKNIATNNIAIINMDIAVRYITVKPKLKAKPNEIGGPNTHANDN